MFRPAIKHEEKSRSPQIRSVFAIRDFLWEFADLGRLIPSLTKIGLIRRPAPGWGQNILKSFRQLLARMADPGKSQAPSEGAAGPNAPTSSDQAPRKKLFGREFYESIGSPKYIVAPMVDRSEFVSLPFLRLCHFKYVGANH